MLYFPRWYNYYIAMHTPCISRIQLITFGVADFEEKRRRSRRPDIGSTRLTYNPAKPVNLHLFIIICTQISGISIMQQIFVMTPVTSRASDQSLSKPACYLHYTAVYQPSLPQHHVTIQMSNDWV